MHLDKPVAFVLTFAVTTMPLWLNFVLLPSWNVLTRKVVLSSLFVLYILVAIYMLTHANYGDRYAPYLFSCVYFIHWAFVTYTVYRLWPRQK